MARDNPISRRTALKATGATAAAALVAGCGGGNGGNGGENGGGNGGESGVEIEPGTEITFRAESLAWHGKEPSDIEDEENPTLQLQEGETYTIGWDEGDGTEHNIALWDEDESAIDSTEQVSEPEDYESQSIEFEASSDIAEYVCEPHSDSGMRGDIEVTGGNGGGNGEENGEENSTENGEENSTENGEENESEE